MKKKQYKDISGQKFGRLTALKYVGKSKRNLALWECKCDCGNKELIITKGAYLRNGKVKSCGCLKKDSLTKHGLYKSRIYSIYRHIKDRCLNDNSCIYKYYGGRGIKVCEEWLDKDNGFLNFYNWSMNNGYSDDLTIDRINTNGDYEPDNCRWTTQAVQMINRRISKNNNSGFTGVYWSKKDKVWYAQITSNKKCIHLGSYKNIEDAIEERLKAEIKYFGKYKSNNLLKNINKDVNIT